MSRVPRGDAERQKNLKIQEFEKMKARAFALVWVNNPRLT